MATREHARPQNELADVIRQYQNLETPQQAQEAISMLKHEGWLVEDKINEIFYVKKVPDLERRIALKVGDSAVETKLQQMRPQGATVTLLGAMTQPFIYESYLDLLRTAKQEVCLPMLATTPHLLSVPILQDRARQGVKIRILLGAVNMVKKLRGAPMAKFAEDSIAGWSRHFSGFRNVEIRLMHNDDGAHLATCMLVDSSHLRFDIYAPETQRSLDGMMLEVVSPSQINPNITHIFREAFERSWDMAEPLIFRKRVLWYFKQAWQWWFFAAFAFITFCCKSSQWMGIWGSVAATFFVNALVGSLQKYSLHKKRNKDV